MSLRAADIDADGDDDVVYSDRFGSAPGLSPRESGYSSGQWHRRRIGGAGRQVMFLDLGDLDAKAGPVSFARRWAVI